MQCKTTPEKQLFSIKLFNPKEYCTIKNSTICGEYTLDLSLLCFARSGRSEISLQKLGFSLPKGALIQTNNCRKIATKLKK